MASKSVQLLLTENVDNLGIVGDVVSVRVGYARNYLLPMGMATEPSEERLAALAAKRAAAEKQLAELRKQREGIIGRLAGVEITLERSCNDQGILYGAVTQQDIATALTGLGYPVKPREVRLPQTIKRVDTYDVHVKFDTDLEADVKVWVVPDRKIEEDQREEMEFDNEGNLIEKRPNRQKGGQGEAVGAAEGDERPARRRSRRDEA
ncbi:MAG TPA: 50S ribosomal protein L9 [Phycisphaerales bacterium]|nr:50S ribosomal protein L9 [Phycisphaerales bacterium]